MFSKEPDWLSAADIEGTMLFRDGVGSNDIGQGALGDCYFLAAMNVVPSDVIENDIIITIEDKEEWREIGAFCVKFYYNGDERYVVVDDKFPYGWNKKCVFVKGGEDGKELWPQVIEKAYAKLYGDYGKIEGGFTHQALSELVDGPPMCFETKLYQEIGIDAFFEKVKKHVD